jgi:hypothetical protein
VAKAAAEYRALAEQLTAAAVRYTNEPAV